MYWIKSL